MSDLLASVIKAHGGLERWNAFEKVSTTIVSGGELWATKGIKVDTTPRRVTAAIHREWTSVAPRSRSARVIRILKHGNVKLEAPHGACRPAKRGYIPVYGSTPYGA